MDMRSDFKQKRDFRPGRRPQRDDFRPGKIERRGPRDSPLEFHEATCAKCGKTCEVPFRPSGNKPVYCRDCFNMKEGRSDERPRFDKESGKPSQLSEINRKLDKIMETLGIE
jgi:CxxC-x17-CxxC domain-containing protein